MVRFSLLVSLLFSLAIAGFSQSYFTAMGLRLGSNFGITLQQKLAKTLTVEGIVSSNPIEDRTTATVLLEVHNPLISKRFNFYIGGGVHNRWQNYVEADQSIFRGVTAIAGGEMTLGRLNLSWDYKPVYHLNRDIMPFESETAVSLRYVFVKKVKSKKSPLKRSKKDKRKRAREKKKKQKERAKRKSEKQKEGSRSGLKDLFTKKEK